MAATFTPQQQKGDITFTSTCLLGNWQEDRAALEHRLKDFVAKKDAGALSLAATSARLGERSRPVPLRSAEPAGSPCFGDVVLLRSAGNGGVIAISPAERPLGLDGDHRALACAPAETGACARTVFQLLSYEGKSGPICYDDKVVLVGAGELFGDATVGFIHTETPPLGAQASDQRVTLRVLPADGARVPYSAAFIVLPADLEARLGLGGAPVGADDMFALAHAQSSKRLAGLAEPLRTDFGLERALSARTLRPHGSVHQLTGERLGTRTLSGYGIKPELAENMWTFVRADADAPAR
jgi:hypothetical protein